MMNRKLYTLVLLVLVLLTIAITIVDASSVTDIFLPLVVKRATSQTASPSGVLYVFSTTATTHRKAGGRSGMNAICSNEDPEAHFCSFREIENAWTTTGVFFDAPFNKSWVDFPRKLGAFVLSPDGSVQSSDWPSEVCRGWSYDNSGSTIDVGKVIDNKAITIDNESCGEFHSVTCCKWSP